MNIKEIIKRLGNKAYSEADQHDAALLAKKALSDQKVKIEQLLHERDRMQRLAYERTNETVRLEDEIERLNKLAQDAIIGLTNEVGYGYDPVAFVCAAYVSSRHEVQELKRLTAKLTKKLQYTVQELDKADAMLIEVGYRRNV